MHEVRHTCLVVGVLVAALAPGPSAAQEPIAVISNTANGITNVTLTQLRDLYLGRKTMFSGGVRVSLAETRGLAGPFYRAVTGMREDQIRRHWIGLVFAGENATPPQELDSAAAVIQHVATHPGSVGFIPTSAMGQLPPPVVVLRVGGRLPSDANYAIR